jgi:hypothetical protein
VENPPARELLQDFDIEEADGPVGADVLGVVAPVADEAGPHDDAQGDRTLGNAAGGNTDGHDSR